MKRLHIELLVVGVALEASFQIWKHLQRQEARAPAPVAAVATADPPRPSVPAAPTVPVGTTAVLAPRATSYPLPPRYSDTTAQMIARLDGREEQLPLRRTEVDAEVAGVMSSVRVHQVFENRGRQAIEATYVFPLPAGAAVHAMTMRIGDRRVAAQIARRDEARNAYEAARTHGQTAALLEQQRANVFTWNVANIQPGDSIDVELEYVQELSPRDGRYEWVFPLTVGPRYLGAGGGASPPEDTTGITPTYAPPGERAGHDVGVTLRLRTGVPALDLSSPTHAVQAQTLAADDVRVTLSPHDRIPNRDLVVSWALAGAEPQAAVLAREDPTGGGHFLLMMQPRADMGAEDLAPREYVFVVDASGSMSGWPLDHARAAVRRCLVSMRPTDRFQIVRFAGSADAFAPAPVPASEAEVRRALAWVDVMSAEGGTEFLPALELAMGAPRDPSRSRVVVFMTDGFIGYETQVLAWLHEHAGHANLFAFGVGSSVNRELIDGMARVGHGEPFVLLGAEDPDRVVDRLFATVSRPALTGVSLQWEGVAVSDVSPTIVPDLFADRPIVVTGRYAASGSGRVTVRGFLAGRPFARTIPVTFDGHSQQGTHPALAYLWARRRIDSLMDERTFAPPESRAPIEERVTQLALDHHLMSEFTSFVAVDRFVRGAGNPQRVGVRAEVPAGVSPTVTLSRDQAAPGDPEVAVRAPADARRVTAVLPDGEVVACAYDARREVWVTNFVIPADVPDGIFTVRVLITLADGAELERSARYQVDGEAPRARLALDERAALGSEVTLRVLPEAEGPRAAPVDFTDVGASDFALRVRREVDSVEVRLPDGSVRAAPRDADGGFSLRFTAPLAAGDYRVEAVARDAAGNATRLVRSLLVGGQ